MEWELSKSERLTRGGLVWLAKSSGCECEPRALRVEGAWSDDVRSDGGSGTKSGL